MPHAGFLVGRRKAFLSILELKWKDRHAAVPSGKMASFTIGEPKRLRDKAHLGFVASQPCLVCGRQPSDPHHLRFAQPRAIGLKVSDEFTVPLCRGHHRQLHQAGNEVAWWEKLNLKPLEVAKGLWEQTHPKSATADTAMRAPPNDETKPIAPLGSQ